MGYYSRARNLHNAARCMRKGGAIPDYMRIPAKAARHLGEYTASAIAAAAFGRPEPAEVAETCSGLCPAVGLPSMTLPTSGQSGRVACAGGRHALGGGGTSVIFNQDMMELRCYPSAAPIPPAVRGLSGAVRCRLGAISAARAEVLRKDQQKRAALPRRKTVYFCCWGQRALLCGSARKPACWRGFVNCPTCGALDESAAAAASGATWG